MKPSVYVRTVAIISAVILSAFGSVVGQHEHQRQEDTAIRLRTELVSLHVLVTDQSGRALLGFRKEDFRVYEDKVEQRISFFSADESPVSWGLILDRSGSMMGMMRDVYRAALHVIDEGTDQDEMFVVTFNDRVEIVSDFASDRHRMENSLLGLRADGQTALWDAVAFGLDHIKRGKNRKKVIVVVTDGEDNASHASFRSLVERVEEGDVLIYSVGMFESGMRTGGDAARLELEKLAQATGARAHFPSDIEQCREAMKEIAREVSQQYVIGYYPTNTAQDGKWRKIQIRVGSHTARTRAGYYAPAAKEAK
ncbi:MAG: VWA domain-containing protein [Acidobacteriota bacterium]